MLSLVTAMQDIRDRLAANFAQDAIEGAVPMAEELQRYDGAVRPYIIYNFADFAPTSQRGLAGVRFDSYRQPINFYSIGPDLRSARDLNFKVLDEFLGYSPSYSGPMTKRPGGGAFAIRSNNGAEEAFIVMASFVFTTEIVDSAVPSNPVLAVIDQNDGTGSSTGLLDNGDGTANIG